MGAKACPVCCTRAGSCQSCPPAQAVYAPPHRLDATPLSPHSPRDCDLVCCAAAGYRLDAPALRVLFNRFDPSGSGSLQLTEFLALTLFMRSSTATFNAFDANRVGTITLNFNQFIYSW